MTVAKLTTLVDAFTASAIDTTRWNSITAGAVALDTANDLVALSVPTSSGTVNLGSAGPYDATGSQLAAQVTAAPNGNGNVSTIMKLDTGSASNAVAMLLSNGAFLLQIVTAGVTSNTTLPTYNPDTHRWWRIRENGGSFAADTSTDGLNWTTLATATYTWAATSMRVFFQVSTTTSQPPGLSATVAHVNTTDGGPSNPYWPNVRDEWGPYWRAQGGTIPADRYVNVTGRTQGSNSTSRGRQYELDQTRAGEYQTSLSNPDGALDPTNTAGPWAGNIAPFQPYRKRAQWPPTRNLLNRAQATAGDIGGQPLGAISTSSSGPSIYTETDSTGGAFVTSTSAWQGATVMQFQVLSTVSAGKWVLWTPQPGVTPGRTYTQQIRVRNTTPSTSMQTAAVLAFRDANGTVLSTVTGTAATLTGSATATWTTITVSATAPSNPAMVYAGVQVLTAPPVTAQVQADGWQLEEAATASAWCCPGTWNPMFAGFVERWTSSYTLSGTYGVVQPTAVDAFALLSQQELKDALTMEITSHRPVYLYTLADPAESTSFTDSVGGYPAVPVRASKYGSGTVAAGTAITSATPSGLYTGSSGTVVTITNPNPGAASNGGAASFLHLSAVGIRGPLGNEFTRMIAFRYTGPTPTAGVDIWCAVDVHAGANPSDELRLIINTAGAPAVIMGEASTGVLTLTATGFNVCDSNWHLAVFGYSNASQALFLSIDQDYVTTPTSGGPGSYFPFNIVTEAIGAFTSGIFGYNTTFNFAGDVSYIAEFPQALSLTDINNLYSAWRNACQGESTDVRYARLLRYGGYTGNTSLQPGLTTSMGPANIDGQDTVSALEAVVATENGAHYVARDGTITFKSRSARYNATAPSYTFGENTAAGEWPYEDCQLDYDSTHLGNVVTVTQTNGGQEFHAQNKDSITNYATRTLSRSVNATDALECQDAADYLLSRYQQPATRVASLKLHPSAYPAMWPVCLSLELGTRVRVMRRPPGAPTIAIDCFVENITWDLDDHGEAFVTLQCSPADLNPYAVFSAWHSTLASTITAGVSAITVRASADTTNPLAAQLGAFGQQLVLGQGTANQETVTIQSVGATSPGWTSAVLTLTAPTTKAHTAGDLVNEPLPSGVTDPSTYDTASAFDSTVFAY